CERSRREFETDLIIAFARRAVSKRAGLFSSGHFDHAFGNERAGYARAEEILAFINRAGLNHGENKIAREFLLQIDNVTLGSAGFFGLGLKTFELLFLTNIGAERNDFRVVPFFDPGKNDRSIEPARICQNNFHPGKLMGNYCQTPSGKWQSGDDADLSNWWAEPRKSN